MCTSFLIHPEELDSIWLEQCKQTHVNHLGLHPVGGKNADETLEKMLALFSTPEYQQLFNQAAQMGIDITCEMHALRYLLPQEQLEKHPDWQRVNQQGERTSDYNFCCSNQDALNYVAQSAVALLHRLPFAPRRVAFWLDDAQDAFCHCEKCAHLSPSDQQLIILNAMLDALRAVHSNILLPYLAYYEALPAPTQIKPHEGIYLEFAPYKRDITRPINDPGCPENEQQHRHLANLLKFFGQAHATVLDYWYDNSLFSGYQKPPKELHVDPRVVKTDIAYYRSLGFQHISSFACYLGADYRALYGLPDLSAFRL
ncbi:MAG: DUF4838 domain-containing protein [Clostridia bacterium]|nr:DUF4838 domain-containing protein [Clostridia bacterium]